MIKLGAGLSAVLAGLLCGPVSALAADQPIGMGVAESGLSEEAMIVMRNPSVGFIRPTMTFDARVSQVTGDNQTTGNRRLLGGWDQFYLELVNPQDTAPGDKFVLYRQVKKVYHPVSGKYIGDLTSMLGVAKVLSVTGSKATIKVERSYAAVYPGDGAIRQTASPKLPSQALFPPHPPEGTATIIELPPGQNLIAQGNVVYIDWGRNDGLKIGDRLDVIREHALIPIQVIGELKVIALEDQTASTWITKSLAPLLVGDRVTPKAMAAREPGAEASAMQERKDALFQEMAATPKAAEVAQEAHAAPVSRDIEAELARLTKQLVFEPGSAPATEASLPILNKIKGLLLEVPDRRIVVEGHTDAQKIGPSLKEMFSSNQELSRARAASVADFISGEGGVSPRNITIVGYSDAKPVATNSTEAGRKQNRRIEITLLPKEQPAAAAPAETMPKSSEPVPVVPEPTPEPAPEPVAPVAAPPIP